ncbi:hypothetical protein [Paraglaciecola sp.]|uniref:hypothetical protein n=1 Tax=Paraglaciecola sp. TaxID=1920173 RepID=UPI003EF9BA86
MERKEIIQCVLDLAIELGCSTKEDLKEIGKAFYKKAFESNSSLENSNDSDPKSSLLNPALVPEIDTLSNTDDVRASAQSANNILPSAVTNIAAANSDTSNDREISKKDSCYRLEVTNDSFDSDTYLRNFVQDFYYGEKPKRINGFKNMYITACRKGKTIRIRISNNGGSINVLSYPKDHVFTDGDIKTIKTVHERYLMRRAQGLPWQDKRFLLGETALKLETFTQLLDWYADRSSKEHKVKVIRLKKRYFSGEKGNGKLAAYCREDFLRDFLFVSHPDRSPSDSLELHKIINSSINQARDASNIEIDVQTLVRPEDRAYSDKTDKEMPKISTFDAFLGKAFELGYLELCLSLIMQLTVQTRKSNSNHQQWHNINFENLTSTVEHHQHKNRKLGVYVYPNELTTILSRYQQFLTLQDWTTKDRKGKAKYLFESRTNRDQTIANYDAQFDRVRSLLLSDLDSLDKNTELYRAKYKDISSFTQHRLRDLYDGLMLSVGATFNQKEKGAGRATSNVAKAYEDLSLSKITQLKNKMVRLIKRSCPNFIRVKQGMIDTWSEQC